MSSADVLQIIYEVNDQVELTNALYELIDRLAFLAGARGVLADLRVSATGGSLSSVGTVSTVSSVTNMGNIQQIGTYWAQPYLQSVQNISGAQGNINNIDVTVS
jgi:hypothetical protein